MRKIQERNIHKAQNNVILNVKNVKNLETEMQKTKLKTLLILMYSRRYNHMC